MHPLATDTALAAMRGSLAQLRIYLTDQEVRDRVRSRVAEQISADTRVLVAHSLGSIVAYEVLCADPGSGVRALVTLGSPLGIRHLVFRRLQPPPELETGIGRWPGPVVKWTNIFDRSDVVALVDRLGPLFDRSGRAVADHAFGSDKPQDFQAVDDLGVDNGWKAHSLSHYLTASQTGRAIGNGLAL
jgi:pimeloyl-ACP methyl ester carboxylesterase